MQNTATFRFYGALNDFLEPAQRHRRLAYRFADPPSIKDAVEAIGPPHPEVGLLLVDGVPVTFAHKLGDGQCISAYSVAACHPVDPARLLSRVPPGRPAFLLDVHLGALARYLRMAGFDTAYFSVDPGDVRLAELATAETRILLSRDIGLLKRSAIACGHYLRTQKPLDQFQEVVSWYHLKKHFQPFRRCTRCNGLIRSISRQAAAPHLPARIRTEFKVFSSCERCHRIYWQGSHYVRMRRILEIVK